MSRPKRILLIGGGVLGGLLATLLVLPYFFLDEVEERVRSEIERATLVRVAWSDVGLGFFRDFPHPTLTLSGLDVVGTDRFEADTLATVGDFRLALNGPSVLRAVRGDGPLVVRSVRLVDPVLRLRVLEDGTASWDVLRERTEGEGEAESGRDVAVSLESLEISGGDVVLDNAQTGLFASLSGLSHSLSGDFSRASLVARTATQADAVTLRFAGAPYLNEVALGFDADFDVDMEGRRARLVDNELRLNDLLVRLDGEVGWQEPDLSLDLTFDAPSTSFAEILSLVPTVYAQDFASLETSGGFSLNGRVQGSYGEEAFPAFALDLAIMDGSFRYPDVSVPARAITADLSITNPGGDVDSTVVDLSRFHMELGEQAVDASITVRSPVSDPDADVRVQGSLDLGDVARTFRLQSAQDVDGVVVADARIRARRSDVDSTRWERIAAQGTIAAHNVTLHGEALRQPVDVRRASVELTPQTAELRTFEATLGSSDLQATGRLDNLLGFVLGAQPLSGTGTFTSRRFDLDEWKSDDELAAIPVPAMFDLTLDGTIDELVYNGLEMTNARGRAVVREERLTLEGFSLETLGGRIGLDGFYETTDPTRPTFALDLLMDSLDVAGAAEAFLTVRTLAPVARYARGTFSTEMTLAGALGQDLTPVLDVLNGDGSVSTSRVAIEGFPLLDRLSERLELQRLSSPTVDAVRSSIHIEGGRLRVDPFQVGIGGLAMTVSGSNGIDQSVDYTLGIAVPRSGFAGSALTSLASRAGPLGATLAAADPVVVSVGVGGTITQPSLDLGLSAAATSLRGAATQSAGAAVEQRIDEAQQRLDAEREEARQRARARADSIVAEAERRAETIRTEARRAAEQVRTEGGRAADEVLARATNPLARAAAQPVADRLRREADEGAAAIEREADERAAALVEEARAQADALVGDSGGR
jgi:hypothetical protein